jgi:hypothetical protein
MLTDFAQHNLLLQVVATESIVDSLIPNQDSITLTCIADPANSSHWVIVGSGPVIPSW